MASVRRMLADTKEHGGVATVGPNGALQLKEASVGSAGQDSINLPHGELMWHTHPQGCEHRDSKKKCGLGMPSSTDMEQIHKDAIEGNCQLHVVFAHDGTYVVALKPEVRRKMHEMAPRALKHWVESSVTAPYEELQQRFERDRQMRHDLFRDEVWLPYARSATVDVLFFPAGKTPRFILREVHDR